MEKSFQLRGRQVLNLTGRDFRLPEMRSAPGDVERCYARALANCVSPISREHFISETILNLFNGGIPTAGIPWLREHLDRVPTNALAANILCTYHNSFLSPLDDMAGRFFENLRSIRDQTSPIALVWGPNLERWLLKVLIGLIAAGQGHQHRRTAVQEIPLEWVEILFGLREFPEGFGLYMTPFIGGQIRFHPRFAMSTLTLGNELKGIHANLAGLELYLSMASKETAFATSHPHYDTILYRPRALEISGINSRIEFFWE